MIIKTKHIKNTGQIVRRGRIGKLPGGGNGSNCQGGGGGKMIKNCTGGGALLYLYSIYNFCI